MAAFIKASGRKGRGQAQKIAVSLFEIRVDSWI